MPLELSDRITPYESSDIKPRQYKQKPSGQEATDIIPRELLSHSEHIRSHSNLYLINTRLWINELSQKYNSTITIGSVPPIEWQHIFDRYDDVWFMGIYQPSQASRQHCQRYPESVRYAKQDVDPEMDIVASPFAVCDDTPNSGIAKNWQEWDSTVDYLHQHGKRVFLDFVPNHVALDHPWATNYPDFFIQGTDQQKQANPNLYYDVVDRYGKSHHLAHGKDPNYPEWSDTLQLNHANPDLQLAMMQVLLNDLVPHCDGVRCDMAMLLNPGTFIRTWGHINSGGHLSDQEIDHIRNHQFWPQVIPKIKDEARKLGRDDFTFIAEAYWDLDELGQTFDFLYEKIFYDHLVRLSRGDSEISSEDVRHYIDFLITGHKTGQRHHKLILFTENHDEDRAVSKFGKQASMAAAVITAFIPNNIFLINQGQDEGRHIRPPMQLEQPLKDPADSSVKDFYDRLLRIKNSRLFQDGELSVLPSNFSENADLFCQKVTLSDHQITVYIITNFCNHQACSHLPEIDKTHHIQVSSLTGGTQIDNPDMERQGGLFLTLKPWESQIIVDY